MVSCPKCGHQNLPSATACSQCGTTLPAAGPVGAPLGDGVEEYARQMAAREAIRRRNRLIVGGIAVVVIGFVAYKQIQDRGRKAAAQEKLNYAEKFVELE